MDIISCFGEIAEENGWKIVKCNDFLYTVESTFRCTCIKPYRFKTVGSDLHAITLGAFVDMVCGQCEDFDISKETYSRLNSDGYYAADDYFDLESVHSDIVLVHRKLQDLYHSLIDRYEKIQKEEEFYRTAKSDEERGIHALESVLNDEFISDGEIVDMMYSLVRDVAKYAADHNSSKTNHTARELLGGTFSEEVLKHFDEPDSEPPSSNDATENPGANSSNWKRGGKMIQAQCFPITYEITVDVTRENIDDIMAAALGGGITHWCKQAEVVGDYLGENASEQISRGGVLTLHGADSDDKWTLSRHDFLQGLHLWFMNGMDVDHGVYNGIFDAGAINSAEADCIIQYALFGKVVFA